MKDRAAELKVTYKGLDGQYAAAMVWLLDTIPGCLTECEKGIEMGVKDIVGRERWDMGANGFLRQAGQAFKHLVVQEKLWEIVFVKTGTNNTAVYILI